MAQSNGSQQRVLMTGKVKDTRDPKKLGRVQVELSGFDRAVQLPWVRVLNPYASNGVGQVFLPEEGDEVVILQGAGGSLDQMVCIGSVYNGNLKPPYSNDDGKNDKKMLKTRSGHELIFSDASGGESITLRTADGKVSLELDHAKGAVTIKSATEVKIECPSGKVNINCATAQIQASGTVDINGGGTVTVTAPTICLNGAVDLG